MTGELGWARLKECVAGSPEASGCSRRVEVLGSGVDVFASSQDTAGVRVFASSQDTSHWTASPTHVAMEIRVEHTDKTYEEAERARALKLSIVAHVLVGLGLFFVSCDFSYC